MFYKKVYTQTILTVRMFYYFIDSIESNYNNDNYLLKTLLGISFPMLSLIFRETEQ